MCKNLLHLLQHERGKTLDLMEEPVKEFEEFRFIKQIRAARYEENSQIALLVINLR